MNYKVGIFGCKHTTKDLILGLARAGIKVAHCVTLNPEMGERQKVAGYQDLRPFLEELEIEYSIAHKYTLKTEEDERTIRSLNLDLGLCMGWQRLIPEWCLSEIRCGVFGMHGSNKPLPHGRGRSPLNWSLIQNKNIFFTHLFKYEPGVDDGPIVAVQKFDITQWDTCHTLHLKNMLAMIKLCSNHLPSILNGTAEFFPQPDSEASYYPKRTAEDGLIYWGDSTTDIFNLIRAVTKPFPGAFAYLNRDNPLRLTIWEAIPFDSQLEWEHALPGDILEVFYDGSFVVKTGDTTLLVTKHEGATLNQRTIGQRLHTSDTPRKEWPDLPF